MTHTLIAYHEPGRTDLPLVPASRSRDWLDHGARHGRRCLPLTMANHAGWFLLNNHPLTAVWGGDPEPESLTVKYDGDHLPRFRAHSNFGFGVLSFMVPYLLR